MAEWRAADARDDDGDDGVGGGADGGVDDGTVVVGGELEGDVDEAGMPIRGWHAGVPIPDLSRLPERGWLDALRPLTPFARRLAVTSVTTPEQSTVAFQMIGQILVEDGETCARALEARPPLLPDGDPPPGGARRQVNFRLAAGEHARLGEAARLFGMRPNMLARVLTVRGVERALHDAGRHDR